MVDPTSPPDSTEAQGQNETSGAQEKVQEAAGQAQEKAQEAAGRAQDMVREQIDQRSTQAAEKVSGTAEDLRSVGSELRNQGKEAPAKLADGAAERAERLGSYLSEANADSVLSDVEDLGRRQPLAVLAGGLVVGIAAARFLKASSRNRYQTRVQPDSPTRELGAVQPSASVPDRPAAPVGAPGEQAPVPAGGVRP